MSRVAATLLALFHLVALGATASQDLVAAETVVIRKVGFPVALVGQRSACGQRKVEKGALALDYFIHVLFMGFKEGTCAQIGYTKFEETKAIPGIHLPLLGKHSTTFDVYSRDPTAVDVASCIGRECEKEVSALGTSRYVQDVAHCISPAFGPCAPKAWECLGDNVCRDALHCLPHAARTCGSAMWKVLTDPVERKKVACIWQCGNSTGCILSKCGKVALECFTGIDPVCHKAAVCLPEQLVACSGKALDCVFNKDGICRENLACVANGAGVCADPAVNMLTDTSVAGVLTCANQHCPAPAKLPNTTSLRTDLGLAAPEHYPEQLACMGLKCAGEVASLLHDKDLGALASCVSQGAGECNDAIWGCLGDASCQKEMRCWTDAVLEDSRDIWRMVTDKRERSYDRELVACVTKCSQQRRNPFARAFCIAGTCGAKAMHCLADSTCRGVFTELPKAIVKCGPASLKDPKFTQAAKCVGKLLDSCNGATIELLRDENIAKIVTCNAQCTRPPKQETAIVV